MWHWLKDRALDPELMDDFTSGGAELEEALRHLGRLNRLFYAAGPTVYGVNRLWSYARKPCKLSILDIGSGSGDVNRALLRWADANEIQLTVTLCDLTKEACGQAERLFRGEPRVRVRQGNLFQLPGEAADIVTASQFVHHFSRERLPEVVENMLRASRFGIVIADIHRHWAAWAAVWLATRLISRNRYIRHDGPLSAAKGFRAEDWEQLGKAVTVHDWHYSWRPLFRYGVTAVKTKSSDTDGRLTPVLRNDT